MPQDDHIIKPARYATLCAWIDLIMGAGLALLASKPTFIFTLKNFLGQKPSTERTIRGNFWSPPDATSIPDTEEGKLILYGRELISHTAVYLGPKGKIKT